jgi:hypothetical protein
VLVVAIVDTPELRGGEIPPSGCTRCVARRWPFSMRLYTERFVRTLRSCGSTAVSCSAATALVRSVTRPVRPLRLRGAVFYSLFSPSCVRRLNTT